MPPFPPFNSPVQNERRRAVRRLTVARGSLEQDRFQRLRKLKDGVECFQNLDLDQQQEVIKTLNIETGGKDACAALLQEDIVLTEEKPEEIFPPTPQEIPLLMLEEIPTPPEDDRPAKVVRLLFLLYIFAINTQCLGRNIACASTARPRQPCRLIYLSVSQL